MLSGASACIFSVQRCPLMLSAQGLVRLAARCPRPPHLTNLNRPADDPALWANRSPRKISFAQATSPFAGGASSGVAAAADAALAAVPE